METAQMLDTKIDLSVYSDLFDYEAPFYGRKTFQSKQNKK